MATEPRTRPSFLEDAPVAQALLPLVLALALLARLPSFFDPPWVNDEGTYFAVAQALAHGYRLYAGIWENKPPAIYLLYESVYHWLGPSLVAVRVLATFAAAIAIIGIVAVARVFAPGRSTVAGMLAGLLLAVPFLEGTTANAEIFLIAFTSAGAAHVLCGRRFAGGLLLGGAILFKVVAGFDVVAIALWLLVQPTPEIRRPVPFVAGVLVLPVLAVVIAGLDGILHSMMRDAVLYDLGYVGNANGGAVPWILILKAAVLAVATVVAIRRSFPVLWLVWAAAGAVVSGRLFGHYALQAVPPLCVVAAMAIPRHGDAVRRTLVALPAAFVALAGVSAITGTILAASGHDTIFARRLQWYANFTRLAIGAESYHTYMSQVDDHVRRNIAVAHDIRTLRPGRLLVWGNIPWVYVLSDRLPATPYTSAIRSPPVPGETRTLRAAVEHASAPVVVVVSPPLPPLGPARASLHARYRQIERVAAATLYVARARPAR